MTKINLLGDQALAALKLKAQVDAALQALRDRSFSGRNPELGKMIKCPICRLRHRQFPVEDGKVKPCVEKYYKDSEGAEFLAEPRPRKDKKVHPSKLRLQLVQRTQKLFFENLPYFTDMKACMQESREMAVRELKKERLRARANKRRISDTSRRINAGLARPGSRPSRLVTHAISAATYQARKAKQRTAEKANEATRIANESH